MIGFRNSEMPQTSLLFFILNGAPWHRKSCDRCRRLRVTLKKLGAYGKPVKTNRGFVIHQSPDIQSHRVDLPHQRSNCQQPLKLSVVAWPSHSFQVIESEGDMFVCHRIPVMPHCRRAAGPVVTWEPLRFLAGQWVGEGSADTKQAGAGACSFEPDLRTKVLVRRNHADYPASNGHSAITHDDLMIIYPDPFLHQLRLLHR